MKNFNELGLSSFTAVIDRNMTIEKIVHAYPPLEAFYMDKGNGRFVKGLDKAIEDTQMCRGWTDILVSRYIWAILIPIYRYQQTGYRYQPYWNRHLYWLLWISVISVSAKYRLKYMDIGQNITIYRPKYQLSAKYRPK